MASNVCWHCRTKFHTIFYYVNSEISELGSDKDSLVKYARISPESKVIKDATAVFKQKVPLPNPDKNVKVEAAHFFKPKTKWIKRFEEKAKKRKAKAASAPALAQPAKKRWLRKWAIKPLKQFS